MRRSLTAPELLAERFPPLRRYCPILPTVSTQQTLFLIDDAREGLYGGAVGGGKSAALLMAALQYVDVRGYSALLLRRTYAELEKSGGLIPLADEWLGGTDARRGDGGKRWTFPSGATIEFGHVQHESDKSNYQGAAYAFVGFDELTHFSESIYDYIGFSRQRRRTSLPVPVRTRATANPGGVGHAWVKRRFIDEREPKVMFVPAKVSDNPGLDVADYVASLAHLPDELRRQLLDGDWGAFEGAAFAIDEDAHFVPPFVPPLWWRRFESMDHGISAPTAWLLWLVDDEQNHIAFDSYYSPGLVSEHAAAVKHRRAGGWEGRDENGWTVRNRVFGDPSIRNRTGGVTRLGDAASVLTEYAEHGIGISPANNDPRAGYGRLRELLKLDEERPFPRWHPRYGERGAPRMYVVRATCPELAEQLRTAPLQPVVKRLAGEIVDPVWEGSYGHMLAACRYGVMSRPGPATEPEQEPEDPRAAMIQRRAKERDRERRRGPRWLAGVRDL